MKDKERYLPEGSAPAAPAWTTERAQQAAGSGQIFEATAEKCTCAHELLFSLGALRGLMPREECALGIEDGTVRDIAILSRVGKPVCFAITAVREDGAVLLSRRNVQKRALAFYMRTLTPGDILPARVTHLESFGAFVDYGCGLVSLIGIENLSISRIRHPGERLRVGQPIFAVVRELDPLRGRVTLSHRELLGTWEQNAAYFRPGETVRGIVRSVEPYGVFIELRPNLSGLAEPHEGLTPGQAVSVYIKSILPQRMKIKLAVVDTLGSSGAPAPPQYTLTEGHLSEWVYSPACCTERSIATVF